MIHYLGEFPKLGREAEQSRLRQIGLRGFPYVLVYRIDPEFVRIIRIFHGASDWPKSLDDE